MPSRAPRENVLSIKTETNLPIKHSKRLPRVIHSSNLYIVPAVRCVLLWYNIITPLVKNMFFVSRCIYKKNLHKPYYILSVYVCACVNVHYNIVLLLLLQQTQEIEW